MRPDLAEQLARLEHASRQARERLADAQHRAGQASARAISRDHLITVTVAVGTGLTDLTIDPRALQQYDARRLAATILATITEASTRLREIVTEQYREALGEEFDPVGLLGDPATIIETVARMAGRLRES
ncbi:MAG: YbaB/EbfC family nucleoid-associated protein [Natronosporangium sp.]